MKVDTSSALHSRNQTLRGNSALVKVPFCCRNGIKSLARVLLPRRCISRCALVSSLSNSTCRLSPLQSKGAKEKLVTRIIVSRCEVDLKKICSEYKEHFGQSLHKTILVNLTSYCHCYRCVESCDAAPLSPAAVLLQEHTKGDYQKALLSLCGPEE